MSIGEIPVSGTDISKVDMDKIVDQRFRGLIGEGQSSGREKQAIALAAILTNIGDILKNETPSYNLAELSAATPASYVTVGIREAKDSLTSGIAALAQLDKTEAAAKLKEVQEHVLSTDWLKEDSRGAQHDARDKAWGAFNEIVGAISRSNAGFSRLANQVGLQGAALNK